MHLVVPDMSERAAVLARNIAEGRVTFVQCVADASSSTSLVRSLRSLSVVGQAGLRPHETRVDRKAGSSAASGGALQPARVCYATKPGRR